jgi:hypothetical protein
MKKVISFRLGRRALAAAVVSLAPLAGAQAVSPLGFEIPTPGSMAASTAMPAGTESVRLRGPTPLGFEIPLPGPRGAAGPVREDRDAGSFDRELAMRLGGIGGANTE